VRCAKKANADIYETDICPYLTGMKKRMVLFTRPAYPIQVTLLQQEAIRLDYTPQLQRNTNSSHSGFILPHP
jgi:hypothetical protein